MRLTACGDAVASCPRILTDMLSTLLFLPLLGAAVLLIMPRQAGRWIPPMAVLTSLATLAYAVLLVLRFDPAQSSVQLFETHVWNPRLGSNFSLGLDGLSAPMLLLATLLCLVAVLASSGIRERIRGYYVLLLLLESALIGVFTARDWSLFYVFWELTLLPLFFLIDRWGGKNRHRAALNFVLYTMGGSVFLLVALLALYDLTPGHSFDMTTLEQVGRGLPAGTQVALLLGLLIGFGVKMPVVPLHGWLPLAHVEAPTPVSILLSGILLKMGAYGLLRSAALLPEGVVTLAPWLAVLAVVSVLYGAVLAWRSHDIKTMIAYSSISHMGIVLFALSTLSSTGLTGAVVQMVAHGFVAGILFLAAGMIYERTHERDPVAIGNLTQRAPQLAFLVGFGFLAAVGLPATAGFVAEIHTLVAGFERYGAWVAIFGVSILASASYAVRTIGQLVAGPAERNAARLPDLSRAELSAAALLAAGIMLLGLWPTPLLLLINGSVGGLARLFGE